MNPTTIPRDLAIIAARIVGNLTPVAAALLDADADSDTRRATRRAGAIAAAQDQLGDQPTAHAFLRALLYGPTAGDVAAAVNAALRWSPQAGTPMLWRNASPSAWSDDADTPVAVADWPSIVDAHVEDPRTAFSAVVVRYDTTTGELHRMRCVRSQLAVRDA